MVVDRLTEAGFIDQATKLLDAAENILAFADFPVEHWSKTRSNHPQERLSRKVTKLRFKPSACLAGISGRPTLS